MKDEDKKKMATEVPASLKLCRGKHRGHKEFSHELLRIDTNIFWPRKGRKNFRQDNRIDRICKRSTNVGLISQKSIFRPIILT